MRIKIMKKIIPLPGMNIIIAIVIAFSAGLFVKGLISKNAPPLAQDQNARQVGQIWTCSMDPQIRQPKSGKCPICGMDLIPLSSLGEAGMGNRQLSFSEDALKLMELQTMPVVRKFVEVQVRMAGKVDYDETRLEDVTAWVPGRIDRLYVDFVGTRVIQGDHMFYLYSPDLISAQAEFLQALKAAESIDAETSGLIRRSTQANLEATREKLQLLGLTDQQIKEIKASGVPTDHITINAPRDGIVIKRHVSEGNYVKTGTPIYTIADFSKLWVKLDAYESDIEWIRLGQEVEFTTEAYPGQPFKGRITFISPTVDPTTRTVKLRVNVDNANMKLKPEMFVRAVVHSKVTDAGLSVDSNLAGKWTCPMHPSVIKDQSGQCDICHMDLVQAVSPDEINSITPQQPPLVIPVTAALKTGKRSIVYVRLPDTEKPTFEGREVVLGPRAGDYYLVKDGLTEGENVVVNGNFKIDSSMQIQAQPSMMNTADTMHPDTSGQSEEQTLCPVMGGPVNKDIFIEYKGKKVYFCCEGCDDVFLKDPNKYLPKLPQFKEE